jgi:hypothetical protein
MSNIGNLFGGQGNTSGFIDPTPYVQYEQQQGALGQVSNTANKGIGPSTMTAQGLAGNDMQAAATGWGLASQEQQNLLKQQDLLTQYNNQGQSGLGTLFGLK